MHRYIEMLDCEIERLTGLEKQHSRVNPGIEQQLHVLFENHKHAKMYMAYKKGEPARANGNDTAPTHG